MALLTAKVLICPFFKERTKERGGCDSPTPLNAEYERNAAQVSYRPAASPAATLSQSTEFLRQIFILYKESSALRCTSWKYH